MKFFWNKKKRSKSPIRRTKHSSFIKRRKQSKVKSRENIFKKLHGKPDPLLLTIVASLTFFGLIMIFSASNYYGYSRFGDSFYYIKKQLLWIVLGTISGYIFYITPLNFIKKTSPIFLGIGIILLLYILPEAIFGSTYVTAEGDTVTGGVQMPFVETLNGATRWINLGFTFLQPSELVKLAFAIYISAWLTKERNVSKKNTTDLNNHIMNVILPFLVLLGFISLLVLAQRDFDTSVVLVFSILIIYFVSGTDYIHTLGSILIFFSAVIFGMVALLFEGYRRARVETFFNIFRYGQPTSAEAQDGAFQVFNGLVGLGSGGFFGNGYGESIIKQGYLQEAAYTDSIYAVVGDEFGFVGAVLIIILFLAFTSVGFNIAKRAENRFAALIAIGVTTLIALQALLNMASVLAVIPFGGMPLPFFTYGGSNTIFILAAVGLLLNVGKNTSEKETKNYKLKSKR